MDALDNPVSQIHFLPSELPDGTEIPTPFCVLLLYSEDMSSAGYSDVHADGYSEGYLAGTEEAHRIIFESPEDFA